MAPAELSGTEEVPPCPRWKDQSILDDEGYINTRCTVHCDVMLATTNLKCRLPQIIPAMIFRKQLVYNIVIPNVLKNS